jgi:hypothetical protein
MNKLVLPFAAVAIVGIYAGSASAQCTFGGGDPAHGPAPAKGIKAAMVRTYAACPSTEHEEANTQTESSTDACNPVTPPIAGGSPTLYSYGPKGGCTVTTKAKLYKSCDAVEDANGNALGLPARPCHVTYVTSKCKGLVGIDGVSPISGETDAGWKLATLSRATLNDTNGGDMTVIDFPVTFSYTTPEDGSMEIDSSSAEELVDLVGENGAALPACTSIEVVDSVIKDPDGREFARLGGATVPK